MGGFEEMCTMHAVSMLGFVVGKVWRIVPCVYKIYTLGRFHGLLGTFLFAVGGGMYIVKRKCVFRLESKGQAGEWP